MPAPNKTLSLEIPASLAVAYRDAYVRAFGTGGEPDKTLEEFITGFVEDRLVEELSFVSEEVGRAER